MIGRIAIAVFAITGLLFLFSPAAFAAGFDCAKASSVVEKLICADTELSKADEELSGLYERALASSAKPGEFKKEQISWIRTVRDPCRNKECLAAAYKKRIGVLSDPAPAEEYYLREPFPTGKDPDDDEAGAEDGKADGPYYHVCVKVHGNASAPLIDFEVYFPDSAQSVTAGLVRCKVAGNGTLEFSFTDNWGNRGKGKLDRWKDGASLSLEEVKPLEEPGWGRNALRNYGDYELTKQKCGSGEDK